jgi:hypothetical protein
MALPGVIGLFIHTDRALVAAAPFGKSRTGKIQSEQIIVTVSRAV